MLSALYFRHRTININARVLKSDFAEKLSAGTPIYMRLFDKRL